jgi:uncharacterized protein
MTDQAIEDNTIAVAAPVAETERLVAIDTLRGVAVLGILVMNIYAFAMPFVAYQNPLAYGGTEWYNLGTWFLTHIFFDQKFMTIFSILFGAGLVMLMTRAEARGSKYGSLWYRRNFWLLLIGAGHGYLLWMGDILFHYALIGMLIFPLRHRSPRTLIIVACLLLAMGMLMSFGGGTYMKGLQTRATAIVELAEAGTELTDEQTVTLQEWEEMSIFMKSPEEQVREDTVAYTGNYADIVEFRAPMVQMMQTQGTIGFIIWRVGGLMLLGMALMKLGIVSGERPAAFYRKMMWLGYGLGLPLVLFSAWNMQLHQWDMTWIFRVGGLPNYLASILIAFGHIALVMLIVKSGAMKSLMDRFSAVGRMAFTNYLMHTIILTTVFYGYGFGLYGQIPRIWQMAFVAGVLSFQLWMSPLWLKHFRFGPAEWAWRSLSYWQYQPMRIRGKDSA